MRLTTPGRCRRRRLDLRPLLIGALGAALLGLAPEACAQRQQGSALGSTKSAILDEKGDVVGAGPSLGVVGQGKPGAGPAKPEDPRVAAQFWFAAFLDALGTLERDTIVLQTVLRTNAIAIKEMEADLAADRATLAAAKTDRLRDYMRLLVNAKEQKLGELKKERDALLTASLRRWSEFSAGLKEKAAECADMPDVGKTLERFGAFLSQKKLLADMRLNLSAGKSDEFRALADRAQADPALEAATLHLRVQDYLERGEMGLALRAARIGVERYKTSEYAPAMATQAQSMEVAYLKMISSKADSTGADIRRTWNEYADAVNDGTIKQVLFGSVRHGVDSLLGRTKELRNLATDSQDRMVLQHNGLEVAWRLREKGVSLEELRLMTPEKLQATWSKAYGKPIGADSAEALTRSLQVAFQNTDVQKLAFTGQQLMSVDMKPDWMGKGEFDAGLFGTVTDAVNVKNVLLLCGPGAVVSGQGATAGVGTRLARAFGRGSNTWERVGALVDTGIKDGVGAREWLLSSPPATMVAEVLGRTKTVGAVREGLQAWCALRYQGSVGAQRTAAAAEILAQLVAFEGMGKLGKAVGGEYGEFIAQSMAVLVGNPIADIQASRVATIKAKVKDLRDRITVAEAAAARTRAAQEAVEATSAKVTAGQTLTDAEIAQARRAGSEAAQASREIEAAEQRAAAGARGLPEPGAAPIEPGASRVAQAAREHADLVAAQAEAVVAGDRVGTAIIGPKVTKGRTVSARIVEDARKSADALDQAATRPPGRPAASEALEPGPSGRPIEIEGARPARDLTPRTKLNEPPPAPSGEPIPPTGPRPPSTHADAYEMGEEAMRNGDFAAARSHFRSATQFENLGADDAALYAKRVREAEHAESFQSAMAARRASGKYEGYVRQCDDAMREWSKSELDDIARMKLDDLPLVSAATGKAETAAAPRLILDAQGRKIGIFKEAPLPLSDLQGLPKDGNLVNEVVVSRIYKDLGLRAPAASEVTLQGASGPVRGVVVRWIPGCRQLHDVSAGARAAMAQQVAPYKAAAVFTGNYDVHMGNFVYDQTGRVWHIDYGMACLKNSFEDDGLKYIAQHILGKPGYRFDGVKERDFARMMRDLYREGALAKENVVELDRLLRGSDMQGVAAKIRRIGDADIDRWLANVIKRDTPDQARNVSEAIKFSLMERRKDMGELLSPWPGATPGTAPGRSPQAWLGGIRSAARGLWSALRGPVGWPALQPAAIVGRAW